jgi:hypothetical protein
MVTRPNRRRRRPLPKPLEPPAGDRRGRGACQADHEGLRRDKLNRDGL